MEPTSVPTLTDIQIHRNAPIPTWFGIGGGAGRLGPIANTEDLLPSLAIDPHLLLLAPDPVADCQTRRPCRN